MPVATFSTTDANDGAGRINADTYPPSGGFIGADADSADAVRLLAAASPVYRVGNALFRWDLSSILGGTATAAEVDLHVLDRSMAGTGYQVIADVYDFGGEPTVVGDITASDTGNVITAVGILSLTNSAVNTFTISDLTALNTALAGTGIYGLRFKLNQDVAPTTDNNYASFATSEHATAAAPLLRVTYTAAPSAAYFTLLGIS